MLLLPPARAKLLIPPAWAAARAKVLLPPARAKRLLPLPPLPTPAEERLLHERVPSSRQHAAAARQRAQAIIHLPRIDISQIERPGARNTLSAIPSKCADGMASLQAGLAAKLHEHGGRLENKDKEIALRFVSNLVPVHSTHPAHLDHILRSGALMSLARQAEVMCRRI
jgi:hypothetical protein